jgi:hypothetical protein
MVNNVCTCPAGTHALGGSPLQCVGADGKPVTNPAPPPAAATPSSPSGITCRGGSTLVGNTCTCPTGTHASGGGAQLQCVPNCGAGQTLSPDGRSCVAAVLNCTGGLVPVNGACGCPAGTTLGAGGQRCLTQCPAGQAQALDGSGRCVAVDANGNQITATCRGGATLVNNTCTCPAGTHFGPNGSQCVPSCGTGQQLSPDGRSCVAAVLNCTGGMVSINGACVCPAGTTTGPRGQCVTQCGPFMAQALDGSGTCVSVDANGNQVGNNITCRGGATLVNNTCTCPAGQHASGGEQFRCVPN